MVAWARAGCAEGEPDLETGIRRFAAEMWPGEEVTSADVARLSACVGLREERGEREPSVAEDRRVATALEIARRGCRRELRQWAWRGWLRPAAAARPGRTAWSLAVAPLLPEPFELWLAQRIESLAATVAELWGAGETPVLVLQELPDWMGKGGGARLAGVAVVRRWIARALERYGVERGWAGPVEVLVSRE
mgnify:CR=1 FL=1